MKRHWIDYQEEIPECPLTYWVHREADGSPWYQAEMFDPPRQRPVPGRGYPVFNMEHNGVIWEFASLAEIDACLETLGSKLMPRTIDLAKERGGEFGPNSHWLSRLPAKAKPWKYREGFVRALLKAREAFAKEISQY